MNFFYNYVTYIQIIQSGFFNFTSGGSNGNIANDPIGAFKSQVPDGVIGDTNRNFDLTDAGSASRTVIGNVLEDIQLIGGILAIGAIVFSGFMFVIPASEETKKTGKMALIYSCIGFFAVVIAPYLINLIVNIFYDLF